MFPKRAFGRVKPTGEGATFKSLRFQDDEPKLQKSPLWMRAIGGPLDANQEKRLRAQEMLQEALDKERAPSRVLAALAPSQDAMDRFVGYDAHLSREFDRILNRLERVQVIRRGRPSPPTLNLSIA